MEPEPTITEFFMFLGGAIVFIFFASALIRGTYRHCVDLFGMHGFIQSRYYRNKPLRKAEKVIKAIVADVVSDPESWTISRTDDYSKTLIAQKGNIEIRECHIAKWGWDEYHGYYGPRIIIGGTDDYTMKNVRGSISKELYETIDNLRAQRACDVILDTLTDSYSLRQLETNK